MWRHTLKILYQKIHYSLLTALFLLTTVGCIPLLIGAAVGAGSMTYFNGSLARNVDESVEDIHKAALAALKGLNLFVMSDELSKHSASIRVEYEDTRKIHISIEALTEFVAEVRIRIGTFGDRDESNAILDAILKEL